MSMAHKGKIYIWKDSLSKRIPPEELQLYLEQGWHKGMVPRSESQKEAINKKRDETNLSRYGNKCVLNNLDIREKQQNTCLARYGAKTPVESDKIKEKIKQTCIEKYGVEYQIASAETREKIVATNLKNLGVEMPFQSQQVLQKCQDTIYRNYGVENPFQIPDVIAKCNTPESIHKGFLTKKQNGTCNTSKPEDELYLSLCDQYGIDNVKRNHFDAVRYPWHCDFYIESEDKFIELNFHWSHGEHPYNSLDEQDQKLLNIWQSKAEKSDYIKQAIFIWTMRDPEKLEVARKNNLNYIRIYNRRIPKAYDLWD